MSEIVEAGGSGKKGKKHAARVGVRMDMTPMVDVAFLLLTFFMLATTLTTPMVMEISLPPDSKAQVEIAETNLLTIRVRRDQAVFWNIGNKPPEKVSYAQIKSVMATQLKENPKLATLIKIDREAQYQTLVDVIDELNLVLAERGQTEKRFSLVAMDEKDVALIGTM